MHYVQTDNFSRSLCMLSWNSDLCYANKKFKKNLSLKIYMSEAILMMAVLEMIPVQAFH